jgi:hypothetical protein
LVEVGGQSTMHAQNFICYHSSYWHAIKAVRK